MGYELPKLPYEYNALEPVMDEQTVRLHHDKHHAGYVAGFNKAEEMLGKARKEGDFTAIKQWTHELSFHSSGHILHTMFWENLTPKGGGDPGGDLQKAIVGKWGDLSTFKAELKAATKTVEGSGWGILAYNPLFEKLYILQTEKHQDVSQWNAVPILVIDVWEHAYYLKYQNDRSAYVENIFKIINWKNVEKRFAKITHKG